jgi:anti-sigma regulatory factor (Ser/Thr protein kinase)
MSKKNRIRTVHLKALKDTRRFNKFTNNQNRYHRRRSKREKRIRPPSVGLFEFQIQKIKIPPIFSILENVESVLSVIYQTKKLIENNRFRQFDFDLSKVISIDDGAATILLSLCYDINNIKKTVRVKWPENPDAKKYVNQIGFRKFFQGYIPNNKDSLNETLKKGRSTILQRDTVPIIHKAMQTVFGVDKKNQSLQGMLIELMTNSVNHAYLNNAREKTWYISTRHDTQNKRVEFCFVDNGDGIINTINVRLGKRLIMSDEDILIRAFDGEFRSRTLEKNRGRGLIVIKKNFKKNDYQ